MQQFTIYLILWITFGLIIGSKWEEHNKTFNRGYEYGIKLGASIIFCPLVLLCVIVNQVFIQPWK